MAGRLKDKVTIVTGSSSGIGEAIAILFASQGAIVTLHGRNKERLQSAFDKLVKANGGHKDRVLIVAGDLVDSSVRKDLIEKTVKAFGRLDVLVANAGVIESNLSVRDATEESYDKVMDTNLKSVFFLIQNALHHLEKTKGSITSISSNLSHMTMPTVTVYCAAKAALNHLTRCLAVDLGAKGIRVNAVLPGFIPTGLARPFGDNLAAVHEEIKKSETAAQPLKGRALTVNDIAETVAFLSSDAAGCITGEFITVDGGRNFT